MKKITSLILLLALACTTLVLVNNVKADEEVVINPIADYRFQDADNLGKDTSGNGFDLEVLNTSSSPEAITQKEDEGGKYLSLVRDEYTNGNAKGTGACLYAPILANGKDWSDLVQGSYTVEATIMADNEGWDHGDRYAVTTGRYNSCYTLVPWRDNVTVGVVNKDFATEDVMSEDGYVDSQAWVEGTCKEVPTGLLGSTWATITTVCDATTSMAYIYVNGVLKVTTKVNGGVRFSNWAEDEQGGGGYSFCIGAQTMGTGSAVQFAKCCYRNVTVYDCALSAENVSEIYNNNSAVISKQDADNADYITSLEAVDFSDIDLNVTDANKLTNIVKNLNSKKVKVNTKNGTSRGYQTFWYPVGDKIVGRVICTDAINVNNLYPETNYQYVCKFAACDVDGNEVNFDDYVEVTEVTMDNKEYVPGDACDEKRHTVCFRLAAKEGVTIATVTYNDIDWDMEEDDPGLYYVQFTKGAKIIINTEGAPVNQNVPEGGDDTKTSGGCGSICSLALVGSLSVLGFALFLGKKRKEN